MAQDVAIAVIFQQVRPYRDAFHVADFLQERQSEGLIKHIIDVFVKEMSAIVIRISRTVHQPVCRGDAFLQDAPTILFNERLV